jgi:alpha-L-rhamnosidase
MFQPAGLAVDRLTVERRTEPIGIDALRPRFAWRVDGDGQGARQTAFQLQVLPAGQPGTDWSRPMWDTGRREGDQSTYVPYSGPSLASRARYVWRVRVWNGAGVASSWSAPTFFEMGLLVADDWSARWIAHLVPDLASEPEQLGAYRPAPLLRRRFTLSGRPPLGRLYITALGVYEAALNGVRVGEERLAPGWTDYDVRIQYQTYDVTRLLREGDNVLAVRLGDGWYAGTLGDWGRYRYGDLPALLCQLECQLPSGETLTVGSDRSWTAMHSGTWLHDLQLGERTDLRKEFPDWHSPGFDDHAWPPVALRAAPGGRLVAARDAGIRVVEALPAVAVTTTESRSIVDLGANAAGVVRLHVSGQPGQHIVVRHAEALGSDGQIYTENLREAEQRDEFILADDSRVVLEPRFTIHGFRYAEISGIKEELAASDIELRVLSSATRLVGSFSCSDPLVDTLQRNIVTSLRANFISIPTDCPQRNERMGWTADLQIFAPTALFNADISTMIDKWLDDLVDAQLRSGAYPDVAPAQSGSVGWGNSAWGDAGVIVPWVLYERCGDVGVLERVYDSMRRYMAFLEADQTDGCRFAGRYGDWVSLGAPTDKVLIGTAYLAHVAELFAQIAGVLSKADDEQHWRQLSDQVRQAFQRRFVDHATGRLTVETQTAYAMALGFRLLPAADRPAAGDRLAELVELAGTHLATGFLGTPLVLPALSENGHHELACRLLRQDAYPSWLFEIRQGATSIWERWNGWTPEHGFYSPRMNSFNHYAFGAVGDWLYRYLAGLQAVEPGYRRTELRPRPGGGFTSARAVHESLYGRHECGWEREGGVLRVSVGVPANTSASVVLPVSRVDGVLLNGHLVASSSDAYTVDDGLLRIEVPPGRHTVEAPYIEMVRNV